MIPYAKQSISDDDIKTVADVLQSDWLTQGPYVERFERDLANTVGVEYSVAVANGTAALHIACLALGVGPGSLVWTSPISFVASANCARYCGADIDFVDIDPHSRNMCVDALEKKLVEAKSRDALPDVVIPVHFAGLPCDMKNIARLAKVYGFKVIEDASHALGSLYNGSPIGACEYSDMTTFSFHPAKTIACGEGGAVTTRHQDLKEALQQLRTHGITRNTQQFVDSSHEAWYYEQQNLGYNYRLSDIHAALGVSQLARLSQFVEQRKACVVRYHESLSSLPVVLPQVVSNRVAWHIFVIECPEGIRDDVYRKMRQSGIGVNVHYYPIHLQPDYQRLGFKAGNFTVSERYAKNTLTIPLYADLTMKDQDTVIRCLESAL